MLKKQAAAKRLVAAICAAPVYVLLEHGLLESVKATAHPSVSDKLPDQGPVSERVVVDGQFVTSRGPGTSLEFSLELVKQLFGEAKSREVAGPMLPKP